MFEVLDEQIEAPRRLAKEPGLKGFFLTPIQDASYWRELAFVSLRVILAPITLAILLATVSFSAFSLSSVIWGWPNGADLSEVVLLVIAGLSTLIAVRWLDES